MKTIYLLGATFSVVDQVRTVCTFNFCKNEVKGDETYTYTYNMRP